MHAWPKRYSDAALFIALLPVLFFLSSRNYLLFHSLVELFSITVGFGVFMIAWLARDQMRNDYLVFLGIAYLFVAGVDLLHVLAYKGMGVFAAGKTSNLTVQLWIGARYMEAFSLLLAPLFVVRRLRVGPAMAAFALVTALLLMSVFYFKVFPDSFIEGSGLTPFKKNSEYLISFILLGAMAALVRRRESFDPDMLRLLIMAIALTVGAELAFTFYVSVFGLSNVIGHFFKLASFYLVFVAVVRKGVREPYGLVFRNLKRSEESLARRTEELAQSQREADEARIRAEAANRAKSEFLASMSHELRTPLNSIIGFSEVLEDGYFGALNEKQREYTSNILAGGRHLLSLINDVLDLSKVEAGRMELEPRRFGLGPLLEDTMRLFRQKALKQDISLGIELEPSADVEVEADERKVKQILFNLLSNALKFTPNGGRVSLRARVALGVGGAPLAVEISIKDSGPGIKPEDTDRLFAPFTQLRPLPGSEKWTLGTGLGLALTRRMVELHGGKIWVKSEPGRGSTFVFTLPVSREAAVAVARSGA